MKTVKIRLDGSGGLPMNEKTLKTVYASGLDFEPDERRMNITGDGIVELQVSKNPYMIHARINVPLYGNIWVKLILLILWILSPRPCARTLATPSGLPRASPSP